jgi:hypothetical protein
MRIAVCFFFKGHTFKSTMLSWCRPRSPGRSRRTSRRRSRRSRSRSRRGGRRRAARPYRPTEEEARATANPKRPLPRMQSSVSRIEPGASGFGGVPGYLNPSCIAAIVVHLRDACGMRGDRAIFCDIGCGEARPVMAALEASPRVRGAIGVEKDAPTLDVARSNLRRFHRLRWNGERYERAAGDDDAAPARKACLMRGNLKNLDSLGCTTHAHAFCYGMPPLVVQHLFRVCVDSPTLRYLVLVYKKQQGDTAYGAVQDLREAAPSCLHFFQSPSGTSQLRMPGQVVHGCCIRMTAAARAVLRALRGPATAPRQPVHTLDGACFGD